MWPSLAAVSRRASGKSSQGRHKQASRHLALVACILRLLRPDYEARLLRRFPRAGLLPPSCVSLVSLTQPCSSPPHFHPGSHKHPSTPSQPHVSREPPPHPAYCPHPVTETNDNITNPRSTDMFTRMTYALTKSKWARDQGEKAAKCLGRFYATLKMADTGPAAVDFTASAVTLSSSVSRLWRSGQPHLRKGATKDYISKAGAGLAHCPSNASPTEHPGL